MKADRVRTTECRHASCLIKCGFKNCPERFRIDVKRQVQPQDDWPTKRDDGCGQCAEECADPHPAWAGVGDKQGKEKQAEDWRGQQVRRFSGDRRNVARDQSHERACGDDEGTNSKRQPTGQPNVLGFRFWGVAVPVQHVGHHDGGN